MKKIYRAEWSNKLIEGDYDASICNMHFKVPANRDEKVMVQYDDSEENYYVEGIIGDSYVRLYLEYGFDEYEGDGFYDIIDVFNYCYTDCYLYADEELSQFIDSKK